MNAVEIADAVTELSQQPFDPAEFPFQFLGAFDNSPTTIKRLRAPSAASTNKSDIAGAVLQRNNIHILVTPPSKVSEGLVQLQESPATAKAKARFLLATDGMDFQAEDRTSGDVIACEYADFADHFGFFLPLAGIETVAEIKENAFDIKATGRLNRLFKVRRITSSQRLLGRRAACPPSPDQTPCADRASCRLRRTGP